MRALLCSVFAPGGDVEVVVVAGRVGAFVLEAEDLAGLADGAEPAAGVHTGGVGPFDERRRGRGCVAKLVGAAVVRGAA